MGYNKLKTWPLNDLKLLIKRRIIILFINSKRKSSQTFLIEKKFPNFKILERTRTLSIEL
jgi:hypothetical protein